MKNDALITLKVPADMKVKLSKLADQDKRTLSDFIRLELEKLLKIKK